MATLVLMPNVGITVESCVLTEWHKQPGDALEQGDVLFTYETDKSTLEETAPVGGTVLACLVQEGDDVPVMQSVCVIGEAGEDYSKLLQQTAAQPKTATLPQTATTLCAQSKTKSIATAVNHITDVVQQSDKENNGAFVSPRARILAQKCGIHPHSAVPTGPEGRIIERDIRTLLANGPIPTPAAAHGFQGEPGSGFGGRFCVKDCPQPETDTADAANSAVTADYRDERLPMIRRTIARQMLSSLNNSAQLTHTLSFDATNLLALRKQFKTQADAYSGVTLGDMLLFLCAHTLKNPAHRALNAHFLEGGDVLRCFTGVHLGVAVDTPRGLYVPTVFHADTLSLPALSVKTRALAELCRNGQATPEQLCGASFTVSNLGNFGIESFTPILNPPQTGILGVNTVTTRIRLEGNTIIPYQAMSLSLTYDHRALDGAPASRFLADLKKNAEDFPAFMKEHEVCINAN